ncbi:hypothetical protein SAMN04487825_1092 [Prevotella sp. kh1p2]|nr:hypothetical protein SAMN04487825_1092 [Prevotella sp. kh1p2]SNU11248.1 hypothetical protein SAMN06298210_1092 [Prevotellaceae bacterium KH2P17]
MSNYKHFKHYYNPYDSLDVEWQHVVSKSYLTIGEIVCLSGYTKSYIWKSRARLTPEGKATLPPENFFILPPLKS